MFFFRAHNLATVTHRIPQFCMFIGKQLKAEYVKNYVGGNIPWQISKNQSRKKYGNPIWKYWVHPIKYMFMDEWMRISLGNFALLWKDHPSRRMQICGFLVALKKELLTSNFEHFVFINTFKKGVLFKRGCLISWTTRNISLKITVVTARLSLKLCANLWGSGEPKSWVMNLKLSISRFY